MKFLTKFDTTMSNGKRIRLLILCFYIVIVIFW